MEEMISRPRYVPLLLFAGALYAQQSPVSPTPAPGPPAFLEGRQLNPEDAGNSEAALRREAILNNPVTRRFGLVEASEKDLASRALVLSPLDPDTAAAQFNARNFPKEKQPVPVRRAYLEIQLQLVLSHAHAGLCGEALLELERLGDEDAGLPFTMYGFGSFTKEAHFQYYMGLVENACGAAKAAKRRWEPLSSSSQPSGSVDYVFPFLAALRNGEPDAHRRVVAAINLLEWIPAGEISSEMAFAKGALLLSSDKTDEGEALLGKTLHAANPLLQYLSLGLLIEESRNNR